MSRAIAPLVVVAALAAAAAPFAGCTDGTTPDCGGDDGGTCGYSPAESGSGDSTTSNDAGEAASPQDSAPPEDTTPPADAAPSGDSASSGDSAPADAPSG